MTGEGVRCGGAHEVKVAIGWDEGDGAVVLEARQPHALVELDVFHLHALVLAATPLCLKQHLHQTAFNFLFIFIQGIPIPGVHRYTDIGITAPEVSGYACQVGHVMASHRAHALRWTSTQALSQR